MEDYLASDECFEPMPKYDFGEGPNVQRGRRRRIGRGG
jgi:hypothetical protein